MTDDDFVTAFLTGSLPATQFRHRDHLRLAWALVRLTAVEAATTRITSGIRYFATAHGHAEKYHETMTQFWVRIVGHMVAARPDITTFENFLATFPLLLEKDLPYRHWRRETMLGPHAPGGSSQIFRRYPRSGCSACERMAIDTCRA